MAKSSRVCRGRMCLSSRRLVSLRACRKAGGSGLAADRPAARRVALGGVHNTRRRGAAPPPPRPAGLSLPARAPDRTRCTLRRSTSAAASRPRAPRRRPAPRPLEPGPAARALGEARRSSARTRVVAPAGLFIARSAVRRREHAVSPRPAPVVYTAPALELSTRPPALRIPHTCRMTFPCFAWTPCGAGMVVPVWMALRSLPGRRTASATCARTSSVWCGCTFVWKAANFVSGSLRLGGMGRSDAVQGYSGVRRL